MLTLDLKQTPYWLDLPHGVRLKLRPLGTSILSEVFAELRDDEAADEPAEDGADDVSEDTSASAPPSKDLARARLIATRTVLEWEGVGDATGKPIPVTDEGLAALLEVYAIYATFQQDYILPAFRVADEGNGSAPSPTGTSETA
ncbi:hypothetical protein AAD018_011510 [Aestuariibius insulae]|uniref:hypothetical protein n=1 Tax=Aestuariibius insulae TaxID=2058287 RepID=UPI00345E78CB